jgi:hypothetical protein
MAALKGMTGALAPFSYQVSKYQSKSVLEELVRKLN